MPGAALPIVVVAALAAGGLGGGLVLSADRLSRAQAVVPLGLFVGWAFAAVGLLAWRRRPENRVGVLLVATGAAWFAAGLVWTDRAVLFTAGLILSALVYAVLAHMLLAFPDGRLASRVDRVVAGAAYAVAVGGQLVVVPFLDPALTGDCPCPENLALVTRSDGLARALIDAADVAGAAVALLVVLRLASRWRQASAGWRRAVAPVAWTGVAVLVLLAGFLLAGGEPAGSPLSAVLIVALLIALAAVPFAFLGGLVRSRFFEAAAIGGLIDRLASSADGLRDDIASALGDESVALAYWLPDHGGYADGVGRPIELPAPGNGRAVTEVSRDGRPVGAIVHDSALFHEPQLVRRVGAAAALALDNQRLQADLRARVAELERSRTEVLRAGEHQRRQLERDLHDGAQQHLVGLRLALGLLDVRLDDDPGGRELVAQARAELDDALGALRRLARGLHPAVLGTRGLVAAVESVAARLRVPTQVVATINERLPAPIESAAYFVVSEALTNVTKHADASSAGVSLQLEGRRLLLEVTDDGTGGADPAGEGLRGLAARVEALDGQLSVGPGENGLGTRVRASIPLEP